jgi:hypothetical protein
LLDAEDDQLVGGAARRGQQVGLIATHVDVMSTLSQHHLQSGARAAIRLKQQDVHGVPQP